MVRYATGTLASHDCCDLGGDAENANAGYLQRAVLRPELDVAAPLAVRSVRDRLLERAGQLGDVLARTADVRQHLDRQFLDQRGRGALTGKLQREIELIRRHVSGILQ